MRALFDLAPAFFAFAAALFWFRASGIPTMLTYWGYVPASDPHRQAVERSARLNSVAAFLSGCAALCAFASHVISLRSRAEPWWRRLKGLTTKQNPRRW